MINRKFTENNFTLIIILSFIVTFGLCLLIGLRQSVWFDEAFSIMLAKKPLGELMHLTSVDTHPPLYYLVLKLWAGLFGWSEIALRSLSTLATSVAVIFSGLLIKRIFNKLIAIWALPFVIFAPFLLRYGFEIRMYALASMIGIMATYILVLALKSKSSREQWLLYSFYAVLVAVGVYNLYYSVLLWATHFIWLIYLSRKENKSIIKSKWMIAYIGSVMLFLPWLPTFFKQITNGALAPISQALTLDNLTGIISFSSVYQPSWQLSPIASIVVLFVIIVTVYLSIRAFESVSKKQKPFLILIALYALIPIIMIAAVSIIRPMYVERYISHVVIGGYIYLGVIVAMSIYKKSSRKTLSLASLLLLVLLMGTLQLSNVGNYNFQRLQKPTVGEITKNVRCDGRSPVLAAGPYEAIELSYYLPNCNIYFYSKTAKLSGGYAALSNSQLRVTNPETQFSSVDQLTYIYYGQPELTMPASLKEINKNNFGSMHTVVLKAR